MFVALHNLRLQILRVTLLVALLSCMPLHAQSTADAVGEATGGAAPGGIFLRTRTPSLPPVKNLRYDVEAKAVVTDDWRYTLPVSAQETSEIFGVIAKQDFLAADVSTRGDSSLFGLAVDSKAGARMLVADLILGDIAKGYGYFAPVYKLAGDYKPVQYNVLSRQQFVAFFVFTSSAWKTEANVLVSQPAKLESVGAPTVRMPNGTRRFDFDAMKRNVQDDAIAANSKHIMENETYYRRERAVRDMQSYADLAQLARELKQQGINIASFIK